MRKIFNVIAISVAASFSLSAAPQWSGGEWASASASENNLAAASDTVVSVSGNDADGYLATLIASGVAKACNGVFERTTSGGKIYAVKSNASITYAFAGKARISAVKIYTYWSDGGRQGFNIKSIEATADGVSWSVVEGSCADSGFSGTGQCRFDGSRGAYAVFQDPDSEVVAEGVTAIRVNFAGVENSAIALSEIEIVGEISGSVAYSVEFLDRDGNRIGDVQTVEAGQPAVPPAAPQVEGFVFTGWSHDTSAVISDMTVIAQYVEFGVVLSSVDIWDSTQTFGDMNILTEPGVTVDVEQEGLSSDVSGYNDPSCLIDDVVNPDASQESLYAFADDAVVTVNLPYPQNIAALELYTYWRDGGRNGFTIKSIQYLGQGESGYRTIAVDSLSRGVNDATAENYKVKFYCPDGINPIARDVVSFRINFGEMDHDGTAVAEIRAVRFVEPVSDWELGYWDVSATPVSVRSARNLLLKPGSTLSLSQGYAVPSSLTGFTGSLAPLTNALLEATSTHNDLDGRIYPITSYSVLEIGFNEAKNVDGIRFSTFFYNGMRDGIAIDRIYGKCAKTGIYKRSDAIAPLLYAGRPDDWSVLAGSVASFPAPEGTFLFENVTALRVVFGDTDSAQEGSTYSEIEVFGSRYSDGMTIIIR